MNRFSHIYRALMAMVRDPNAKKTTVEAGSPRRYELDEECRFDFDPVQPCRQSENVNEDYLDAFDYPDPFADEEDRYEQNNRSTNTEDDGDLHLRAFLVSSRSQAERITRWIDGINVLQRVDGAIINRALVDGETVTRIEYYHHPTPSEAKQWCKENGYVDPFQNKGKWFAFEGAAVMPVEITKLIQGE